MWIVINISGKQEIVRIKQIINIDYQKKANVFDIMLLNRVLLIVNKVEVLLGTPLLKKFKILAIVVQHCYGKKILVLRFKRKKHYKKIQGFRPKQTKLLIKKILENYGT